MEDKTEPRHEFAHRSDLDVGRTLFGGFSWRGTAELVRQVGSALTLLLIAYLVGPVAFGIVGMTDVFLQFLNVFIQIGFDAAVIQRERLDTKVLSSLFWINIGMGLVLAGICAVAAPQLSRFYHEPQLTSVATFLSASFVLQSLSVVQRGLLNRQMAFRTLAIIDILATILSSVLAVVVAWIDGSYWSLVVLQLTKLSVLAVGLWVASPWRPGFVIDIRNSLDSLRFSGNILIFNTLNFFATRLDVILIGRILGAEELGFYLLANRLVFTPLGQILNVLEGILLPILSAVQERIERVREIYLTAILSVFKSVAPLLVATILIAPIAIQLRIAEEWAPIVPIFIVWSIGGMRRIMTSRLGVLYLVMKRPDLQWKFQLISTPVVATAILMGVRWGALGVAITFNVAQLLTSLISMYLALGLVGMGIGSYLWQYRYAVVALSFQYFLGYFLAKFALGWLMSPYITGVLVVFSSFTAYVLLMLTLDSQFVRVLTAGHTMLRRMWQDRPVSI
ncbi:MAG: lipopolysaccharide biosynthesis protein [Anaerolineales bacterium]|nr:lipopolysaccharide biosynthesis protein [Anaerolineales bacterium]